MTAGTFFFVHGTGVREAGFTPMWETIQEQGRRNGLADVRFLSSLWGPTYGVKTDRITDVLPEEIKTRAVGEVEATEEETKVATWALLVDDPLFELRVAAGQAGAAMSGAAIGRLAPDQAVIQRLTNVSAAIRSDSTAVDLSGTGLTLAAVADALMGVARTAELREAAAGAQTAQDPELLTAISRAVVAQIIANHRRDEPGTVPAVAMSGGVRDDLVEQLTIALEPGAQKGLGGWLEKQAKGFVARKATAILLDRRAELTATSLLPVGDILYYQRRGNEISDCVIRDLRTAAHPVVAVGHSLGGIILVDILSRPEAPKVDLLVTVGSQAPLFFAIDALENMRRGQGKPFVPWLNIYSNNDFLSFCAGRVFGLAQGIEDVVIDSGVPFPEAHGAYWYDARTYKAILDRWP